MIKLYDFDRCPYCQKVRIALYEKGIPYEKIFVDLAKKEQKSEWFMAMNPYGKVPVLVDGTSVVYESSIINEYLDERYSEPPLMPKDPYLRAKVRMLVDFAETRISPPWLNLYRRIALKKEGERDEEGINAYRNEIETHLVRLREALSGGRYLVGDYSLADIAFTPRVALFEVLGIRVTDKDIAAWIERLKGRMSFSEVAPVL
ncbi:MAG: glutathione S-transferase family protein [Candidatus Methanosuratincola sp.]|jgi:glutathione S-transferase